MNEKCLVFYFFFSFFFFVFVDVSVYDGTMLSFFLSHRLLCALHFPFQYFHSGFNFFFVLFLLLLEYSTLFFLFLSAYMTCITRYHLSSKNVSIEITCVCFFLRIGFFLQVFFFLIFCLQMLKLFININNFPTKLLSNVALFSVYF